MKCQLSHVPIFGVEGFLYQVPFFLCPPSLTRTCPSCACHQQSKPKLLLSCYLTTLLLTLLYLGFLILLSTWLFSTSCLFSVQFLIMSKRSIAPTSDRQ